MDKVKAILNPGYKETDAILYDIPNSQKNANVDPATTTTGASTGATSDPLAANNTTTQPIQDSKANHARYDSGVAADDQFNRRPIATGHPVPVQEESHMGRDAALGAGAAGVAAHEHNRATETYTTSGAAPVDTTGTSHNHHYGRDAAIGAGAVGAAEAAHHHHKHEEEEGFAEEGQEKKPGLLKRIFKRGDKDDVDDAAIAGVAGHENGKLHKKHPDHGTSSHHHHHHDKHQGAAATQTTTDGTIHPEQINDHHYGRDAALGAGVIGAGAAAHHHHHQHDKHQDVVAAQNTAAGTVPPQQTRDHHYGRDAALGAGAVGAGAAAHHHHHQHDKHQDVVAAQNTASGTVPPQQTRDHHYGRDAALGAGAIGAGAAAHHHHEKKEAERAAMANQTAQPVAGAAPATTGQAQTQNITGPVQGHHYGRDAAIGAGSLGAGEAAHHHHEKHRADATAQTGKDHHYGRDAAIGAGAIGAGEAAHHHHEKQMDEEAAAGEQTQKEGKPSILKRIFKRGDKDIDEPEQDVEREQDHHYGRDAAIGAGVAGTGTTAALHHHEKQMDEEAAAGEQTQKEGKPSIVKRIFKRGDKDIDEPEQAVEGEHDHHYGRDAAIGAGAIGAGEAAHHHHEKQMDEEATAGEQTQKEGKPSIVKRIFKRGDKDVEEPEQDVEGEHDHHYGRDAAIGAGAIGAGEAAHHHHEKQMDEEAAGEQTQKEGKPSIVKRIFKRGDKDIDEPEQAVEGEHDHHYGRDAAIGAGAAGAGVAAAHHHNEKQHEREVEELGVPADQKLYTQPETKKKEHGIISQVLNPNGDKADTIRYGTTASSQEPAHREQDLPPAQKKETGMARQILNPNNDKYDAARFGQPAPTEQTRDSHLGRDAAIGAGAVGATGLAAAHEQRKHKLQDEVPAGRTTAGAIEPTTARSDLPQVEDDGGKFMDVSDFSKGSATSARTDPAVAAAQKAYKDHENAKAETSPISPTSTTSIDSGPATKTQGPHKSNIMNILDPRVRPDFQQMKANKEVRKASIDGGSSPTALAAAEAATGATTGSSSHETPKADGLEQNTATTAPTSNNAAETSAPVNKGPSTDLDNTAPQHHGIVTGERGVAGDAGNPYSSRPVDPRVNMPGSYPTGTPAPQ